MEKITVQSAIGVFIVVIGFLFLFLISDQQLTMAMAHEGFSDAQIVLLHSRLDTFENALGRKTW